MDELPCILPQVFSTCGDPSRPGIQTGWGVFYPSGEIIVKKILTAHYTICLTQASNLSSVYFINFSFNLLTIKLLERFLRFSKGFRCGYRKKNQLCLRNYCL